MTLAGSPALDLAIASLTGRGRASAADSKIFKNSLGSSLLQKITYLLPTSTSHPLPTYPIPPRPLRECGPVHFLAKKPLSASRGRGAVDIRSSSSSRQHPSGVACSHLFFPRHSSSSSLVPAPSVCPSVVSVSPAKHSPNLPACLAQLEVSFCASAVGSTQHPDKRRLLSPTHSHSCRWSSVVVDRRPRNSLSCPRASASPAPREIKQNLEWYSVHILHGQPA